MWNKDLAACARVYPTGVLTFVDDSGFPYSVRCTAHLDDDAHVITLKSLPPGIDEHQGKACLLFHRHKADFGDQHELMVKGDLASEDGLLIFRPNGWLTGSGSEKIDRMPISGTMMERIQFMRLGRSKAREYLKKRGEPWPPRPWDKMLAYLDK